MPKASPTVRQSFPPPPTAPVNGFREGSILSTGIPIGDVAEFAVHMLLYGVNRIGKSTLACQFPKPLALVNCDVRENGSAQSVKGNDGVTYFRVTSGTRIEQLGRELQEDAHFKTVVIDDGTGLEQWVLAEVCGWRETINMNRWGKVSQDQYTERSERMRRHLRPFFDLTGKNVVLIANERDHNKKEGERRSLTKRRHEESFFAAAMGDATTLWAQGCCPYICQLYLDRETVQRPIFNDGKPVMRDGKQVFVEEETGRQVRRLRTQLDINYAAGFCSPLGTVPPFIQADSPREMFDKMWSLIRGGKVQ
jgi:hypothetical protein